MDCFPFFAALQNTMNRKQFLLLTIYVAILSFSKTFAQDHFRIMFYNVENLFDTKHDSLKNDYDYLPGGFMNWNDWKYWEKQRNIGRVITAVGEMQSPALVGLCEIEND